MTPTLTQILHVTRSGMLSRLMDLDVVSNNLANINTVGYKSSRSNFQEMLNDSLYNGVQLAATQRFMDQGSLRESSNPFDIAVQGDGFFAVTLPDGRTAYTRDGQFSLDANLKLVTANGYPLVWQGTIPADASAVHVNPDGSVMALQGNTWNQVGTIQLNRFANPSGLQGFGQNLWLPSDVSGQAQAGTPGTQGFGQLVGNALEASNVNPASEMTSLITLQRSFELSLRTFQQTDQMLSEAIHMRK